MLSAAQGQHGVVAEAGVRVVPDVMLERVVVRSAWAADAFIMAAHKTTYSHSGGQGPLLFLCRAGQWQAQRSAKSAAVPVAQKCPQAEPAAAHAHALDERDEKQRTPQSRCKLYLLFAQSPTLPDAPLLLADALLHAPLFRCGLVFACSMN
jgi:hypothetical protein